MVVSDLVFLFLVDLAAVLCGTAILAVVFRREIRQIQEEIEEP